MPQRFCMLLRQRCFRLQKAQASPLSLMKESAQCRNQTESKGGSNPVETERKLWARSKLLLLTDDRDELQVALKMAGVSAAKQDLASWHRM